MTRRKSTSKITVEELLQSHNPEIKAVVAALRGLILETIPIAAESANAGRHSISALNLPVSRNEKLELIGSGARPGVDWRRIF